MRHGVNRMRRVLLNGPPVETVPDKGAHQRAALVLCLGRVRRVLLHVIRDLGGVAVGPVGKVEGYEDREIGLLGGLVGEGELRRCVLVDAGAVEREAVDADGLRDLHVFDPVGELVVLDDPNLLLCSYKQCILTVSRGDPAYHEVGKDILRFRLIGDDVGVEGWKP